MPPLLKTKQVINLLKPQLGKQHFDVGYPVCPYVLGICTFVCMIFTRSKLEGGNDVVVVLQFVDLWGEGVGRGEHLHLDTIQDFLRNNWA